MLIATHYLLLKNWDIFATRCCILLIFNHNYFRGGEVSLISKRQAKIEIPHNYLSYVGFVFSKCQYWQIFNVKLA